MPVATCGHWILALGEEPAKLVERRPDAEDPVRVMVDEPNVAERRRQPVTRSRQGRLLVTQVAVCNLREELPPTSGTATVAASLGRTYARPA